MTSRDRDNKSQLPKIDYDSLLSLRRFKKAARDQLSRIPGYSDAVAYALQDHGDDIADKIADLEDSPENRKIQRKFEDAQKSIIETVMAALHPALEDLIVEDNNYESIRVSGDARDLMQLVFEKVIGNDPEKMANKIKRQIKTIVQRSDESLHDYIHRFKELTMVLKEVAPNDTDTFKQEWLNGINHKHRELVNLIDDTPNYKSLSLNQIMERGRELWDKRVERNKSSRRFPETRHHDQKPKRQRTTDDDLIAKLTENGIIEKIIARIGNSLPQQQSAQKQGDAKTPKGNCFNCGEAGHYKKDCPKPPKSDNKKTAGKGKKS